MGLKATLKRLLTGRSGLHPHAVRRGLLRGLTFYIDPAIKSQRLLGLDEMEIAHQIHQLAADARSAMDVGANDGWYSLYFASRPNVQRVIAFEPCANLLDQVRENFALNDPKFATKVSCVPKFVGNSNDEK